MSKEYIKNIYKSEIRNGFLVTTDRKKIWQKEIEILLFVDNVCKKYNIKWFVDSGTLLGAVRHHGFIPWDDDIDIVMPRPDYEKFQSVIKDELGEKYFFQSTYTDIRTLYFSKIMDENTSAIEFPNVKQLHQGIFVDIFPLDISAGIGKKEEYILRIAKEMWILVIDPNEIRNHIDNHGYSPAIPVQTINKLLKMSTKERFREYENFLLRHYYDTQYIHRYIHQLLTNIPPIKRSAYDSTIMLPFEEIMVPVPSGYNEILMSYYGDWKKMVRGGSLHEGLVFSTDISYKVLLEQLDFEAK